MSTYELNLVRNYAAAHRRLMGVPSARPPDPAWRTIFADAWAMLEEPHRVASIQRVVCKYFEIDRADMLGQSRIGKLVLVRHVAMYLAKLKTHKSFPEIGRLFNRDHTVVLYAWNRITMQRQSDVALDAHIRALMELLKGETE